MMYRKATLDDCHEIYRLICDMECRRLPFDQFSAIYRGQMRDRRYYCLVCERNHHVAGVLNLRFEGQLHHAEWIAEIMEFAVGPAYRDQGIGKEMLSIACQLAKDFNCLQIEAACNQLRTDAHRFYEREGMKNFHFKFSKSCDGGSVDENRIGR